jgi:hypothetical protein
VIKAKGEGDLKNANELVREVAWSVEEGSLARVERTHAIAIACKKLREGAWKTPFRMPFNPECPPAGREIRSAAGL